MKLKIRWFFEDIIWCFKYRFISKYQFHKLDTGFQPNYYDPCVSVPAALFETCSKFVEHTDTIIEWDHGGHKDAWKAFKTARDYWRGGFSDRLETDNDILTDEAKKLLCGIINHIDYMWYP